MEKVSFFKNVMLKSVIGSFTDTDKHPTVTNAKIAHTESKSTSKRVLVATPPAYIISLPIVWESEGLAVGLDWETSVPSERDSHFCNVRPWFSLFGSLTMLCISHISSACSLNSSQSLHHSIVCQSRILVTFPINSLFPIYHSRISFSTPSQVFPYSMWFCCCCLVWFLF